MTAMNMKQMLYFILILLYTPIQPIFGGFMRKYYISVESVKTCPENEKLESPLRNIKFQKINASIGLLSYDIHYKRALDENVGILLKLEKWTEQGWVSIPLLPFQKDVCRSSLNSPLMRDMWINWGKQMGVQKPDKCPIPAGNFSMKNAVLDLGLIKQMPIWRGHYKSSIIEKLVDRELWIYCLEICFETKEII